MGPLRRLAAALLGVVLLAAVSACSSDGPATNDTGTSIVVGAYPFQFAAERVAGDLATVTNLLAPGADGHDLELSPKQVAAVGGADLVVYLSGYQPMLDDAVGQQRPTHVLDAADFLTLRPGDNPGSYDPHVWLDPTNVAAIGQQVSRALGELDPDNAATFEANARELSEDIAALDESFSAGLANCRTDTFITNHAAFGYLADRYRLTAIGISGLSTESEPSPARIAEVHQLARDHQLTTIFFETAVSPKLAETIASDLGLATDVLDPLETLSADSRGNDYIEVMTANLESLRKANGCR